MALPALPDTVARFAAALACEINAAGEPLQASTITTWCAAISAVHGYTDPAADPPVRETLRGIRIDRAAAGDSLDQAAPIMTADLTHLLTAPATTPERGSTRSPTAATPRYYGWPSPGRGGRSEVVGLEVRDIHPESDEHGNRLHIRLRGNKTRRDQVTEYCIERGREAQLPVVRAAGQAHPSDRPRHRRRPPVVRARGRRR